MVDTTKLTGGEEGAKAERRTGGPNLQGKLLERVPGRARRSGMEEARSLARGMPTEFTTADGEKVTLVMEKPKMTPQEERELLMEGIRLEIDLRREILRMLPEMPRDARNETIEALFCTDPMLKMINMAPCDYNLTDIPARPPIILMENSME
ncbi:MAG: hypothetical protein AB1657_05905 [Candidatus Micrarchaeota archaeon]